jgi:hypothetical protein
MNISINKSELFLYKKMKLCKDCKFFINSEKLCYNFKKQSLIDGKIEYPTAEDMRNSTNYCGIGGKYFVQKD